MNAVKIPYDQLSNEALQGVIEEFVTRDGTDYGEVQIPFGTKITQVLNQLKSKDAFIVFDQHSETCTILLKDDHILNSIDSWKWPNKNILRTICRCSRYVKPAIWPLNHDKSRRETWQNTSTTPMRNGQFIPVFFNKQIQEGTFEYSLSYLIDNELDLSIFDNRFRN